MQITEIHNFFFTEIQITKIQKYSYIDSNYIYTEIQITEIHKYKSNNYK